MQPATATEAGTFTTPNIQVAWAQSCSTPADDTAAPGTTNALPGSLASILEDQTNTSPAAMPARTALTLIIIVWKTKNGEGLAPCLHAAIRELLS